MTTRKHRVTTKVAEPPVHDGAPPVPPVDLPDFAVDEGPMRSELRRQIARLEQELTTLVVTSCPWEPRRSNAARGPAVQSGAALEQIRDELLTAIDQLTARIAGMGAEEAAEGAAGPAPRRGRLRRRARTRD
jgi:hypothetical protein